MCSCVFVGLGFRVVCLCVQSLGLCVRVSRVEGLLCGCVLVRLSVSACRVCLEYSQSMYPF